MPQPLDLLRGIDDAITSVLQADDLTAQQVTFVQHIQKTNTELLQAVAPIPQTEYGLTCIMASFGESFLQQQAVVFGYARLLLEQPDSFDGATLNPTQHEAMKRVATYGQSLYQLTENLIKSAQNERLQNLRAKPVATNLVALLERETPILHYIVRDCAINLSVFPSDAICLVVPYHLSALLHHVVTVLSHELVEYGHMKVTVSIVPEYVVIDIFCTGIQLDDSELAILFKKEGRYLYPQKLEKQGGKIQWSRTKGHGATIHIFLPLIMQ